MSEQLQYAALGRAALLGIPVAILLLFVFPSYKWVVLSSAAVGFIIAHVRATLFIGRLREDIRRNPLAEIEALTQGADIGPSSQARFIFFQGVIGAVVYAFWAILIIGVAWILK